VRIVFLIDSWWFYAGISLALFSIVMLIDDRVIRRKFARGEVPKVTEFAGVYRVYMLPRWLFFWFRNVKLIEDKGETARNGGNVAYGRINWGKFLAIQWRGLCFHYGYGGSRFPFSMIRDFVKRIAPGVYLGLFCLYFWRFRVFLFWFLLVEKGKEVQDVEMSKM